MSYQIKSTPYFRRMFNNSKKNGQLQQLREEYERIQEFNDRTIELKMRQVRLKRLFREIEEIKDGGGVGANTANNAGNNANNRATGGGGGGGGGGGSPSPTSTASHSGRRRQRNAAITPEQRRSHQRAEALIRSRELGKELSRRNAQMTDAGVGGFLRADLRATAKMRAVADARREALERRERAAKRISYGNDQSRQNLQRQLQACLQRRMATRQPQPLPEMSYIQRNDPQPDYGHLTVSRLDMMADEEELAAEQRRFFREQEDNALQLAEKRYRLQEQCLMLQAEYSEEGDQEDQEELRFLRGEQTLSTAEEEDEGNEENSQELRQQHHHQPSVKRPKQKRDQLELELEKHTRRQEVLPTLEIDYSDEGRPEDLVDEKEAEQLGQREKTTLLPLGRFSLSSTDDAPSHCLPVPEARSHRHHRSQRPQLCLQVTLSSEQEMHSAPLATEEQVTGLVATRSTTTLRPVAQKDSQMDDLAALNNWRRVSLMMPWFKVFSARKFAAACPVSGSLVGSADQQLRGGETDEPPPLSSMMDQPEPQQQYAQ